MRAAILRVPPLLVLLALVVGTVMSPVASAQRVALKITPPKEQFGHDIGADYELVNYARYAEYLRRLDRESDRLSVVDIGRTEEGRRQLMAIVTSPENHRRLAHYKNINRKLALADGLNDEQARQLAKEGKAVVWIDGGLHATEVLGAQQLIETVYQLTARTDAETRRILQDTIVLGVMANPDGMDLVSDWYMREPDPRRRSLSGLPRLYQKYIGHDNNRDFYMMNMSESVNANQILYREWYPAIMYNHHQTGPPGAVLFAPPFRDPFNYHLDPLVVLGIDLVGAAMHTRLAAEGKPGAVMRSGAPYSTWFNGGIRTTSYFHNQIGILTEMIGSPTPTEIPFVPDMQLPRADVPNPIAPQAWHFRRSIEYSLTCNYAILDLASTRREEFLFNMYRMARNAINKGSHDTWTIHPSRVEAARVAMATPATADRGAATPTARGRETYEAVLHDQAERDPRGFIVPIDQPDPPTVVKFVNTLIKAGVVAHRASTPFSVGGKAYPAGSFVFKAAQPFRAHLMDMFEPQDHPHDVAYPGGPPRPPYDVAGYTLAYSMGIAFDRILDPFDGPFEPFTSVVSPPPGRFTAAVSGGYLISHEMNDAFVVVNRLLRAGQAVSWLGEATADGGRTYPIGTIYVPATTASTAIVRRAAIEKGVSATAVASAPGVPQTPLKPRRIGLWDQYGGSMSSGWTRWLFEQYEFPFEIVYPQTLDAGGLRAKFDVLVFVDGAIPVRDSLAASGQPEAASIPAEYRARLGRVTVARTVPKLRDFVEQGGVVLAIGSATALGYHLGLPIRDALVERGPSGTERPLPLEKFYIPGSLLDARIENRHPLAWGMGQHATVFHDQSPAFRLLPESAAAGVVPVAWYENASPLRSGWAWGQQFLDQAVSIVDAPLGAGRVVLYGSEVAWRGQPHGTFKLLFNGIYYAAVGAWREGRG